MTNLGENLIQRFQDKFHKAALRITGGSFLCKLAAYKETQKTLKMGTEKIQMIGILEEKNKHYQANSQQY